MRAKRWQLALVCLLLFVGLVSVPQATWADEGATEYAPGQMLVKLRDGAGIAEVTARYSSTVMSRLPGANAYLLRLPSGLPLNRALRQAEADPSLAWAEPNYTFWVPEAQRFILDFGDETAYPDADPGATPNQRYVGQWANAKIGLAKALERTRGAGIVVAVLDTGIDFGHPALQGKLLEGWDFVDGDNNPFDQPGGRAAGHGTFVSGIVALVAPGSKILPVRVLNSDGTGTLLGVAQGVMYAADRGARVINLSLGAPHDGRTLREAVMYAVARGAVVVASVGNHSAENRGSIVLYPARYNEVLAVAATDRDDRIATFSNFGKSTDLCAPGVAIYSTYTGGGYAWWDGTSPSAAFVSGGAALLRAAYPTWDIKRITTWLKETAVDIDALNDHRLRGKLGAGRIDLDAATRPKN